MNYINHLWLAWHVRTTTIYLMIITTWLHMKANKDTARRVYPLLASVEVLFPSLSLAAGTVWVPWFMGRVNAGGCVGTMMTSSNGKNSLSLALCVENSPVTGEFPAPRPVTRSFEVFFDLRLNKRLSKQWLGWWLETQSCSLRRHCSDVVARCSYCPFEPITSPRIVFISHDCSPTCCACINATAIDLITMKDRICYGCMSALDTFKNPPFSYSDAQWTCTMTFPFHALQKIRS